MESMGEAIRNDTDEGAGEEHPTRRPGAREKAVHAARRGAGDRAASGDTRQPPRLAEDLTRPFQSWDKWISAELKNLRGQRIPEYDAAISSCSVTLQQIVDVRYRLH